MRTKDVQKELRKIREKMGVEEVWKSRAGCTASVVLITRDQIYCANAGDSRTVISKNDGKQSEALSYDHKPNDEVELNRIKSAGEKVRRGRIRGLLAVSRAFGDFKYKDK